MRIHNAAAATTHQLDCRVATTVTQSTCSDTQMNVLDLSSLHLRHDAIHNQFSDEQKLTKQLLTNGSTKMFLGGPIV